MIDYEAIRRELNAVWVKGQYDDVCSTPTNKMLIPGTGVASRKIALERYIRHCNKLGIEPVALNGPPQSERPHLFDS
jgi:hypothetical protein